MYRHWAALDRYGNYVFIVLFVVMWRCPAFFDATFGAVLDRLRETPARRVTVPDGEGIRGGGSATASAGSRGRRPA